MIGRILFIFILGIGISLSTYQFHLLVQNSDCSCRDSLQTHSENLPYAECVTAQMDRDPLGREPGNTESYSLGGSLVWQSGARE